MKLLSHLLPNPSLDAFLESLKLLDRSLESDGPVYKSALGPIGLELDCRNNHICIDYSDTPLACKIGGHAGPILVKGLIANAMVAHMSFLVLKDYEYLGAAQDNDFRGVMGFKSGDKVIGVATDGKGEIVCTSKDIPYDKNKRPTMGAVLTADLAEKVSDTIHSHLKVTEHRKALFGADRAELASMEEDMQAISTNGLKVFQEAIKGPIEALSRLVDGDPRKLSILHTTLLTVLNKPKAPEQGDQDFGPDM